MDRVDKIKPCRTPPTIVPSAASRGLFPGTEAPLQALHVSADLCFALHVTQPGREAASGRQGAKARSGPHPAPHTERTWRVNRMSDCDMGKLKRTAASWLTPPRLLGPAFSPEAQR